MSDHTVFNPQSGHKVMDVILELLKERDMNYATFARRLGCSSAHFSNWKKRGFPNGKILRAAEILGVSSDVLLGRPGNAEEPVPVHLAGRIPVVGEAKLGDDGFFTMFDQYPQVSDFLPIPSRDAKAFAVKCVGASMLPRIRPGEFVIGEPSFAAQPGDEVIVEDDEGRVMVKKLLYRREGIVYLASVNENYAPVMIEETKIRHISPVLAIVPPRLLNLIS